MGLKKKKLFVTSDGVARGHNWEWPLFWSQLPSAVTDGKNKFGPTVVTVLELNTGNPRLDNLTTSLNQG